jgi:hypothetical protein
MLDLLNTLRPVLYLLLGYTIGAVLCVAAVLVDEWHGDA